MERSSWGLTFFFVWASAPIGIRATHRRSQTSHARRLGKRRDPRQTRPAWACCGQSCWCRHSEPRLQSADSEPHNILFFSKKATSHEVHEAAIARISHVPVDVEVGEPAAVVQKGFLGHPAARSDTGVDVHPQQTKDHGHDAKIRRSRSVSKLI